MCTHLELDQFVGENFLVTVHGPISPKVPLRGSPARDGSAAAARMESGRLHLRHRSGLGLRDRLDSPAGELTAVAEIAREVGPDEAAGDG